jgi:hypothetical protein
MTSYQLTQQQMDSITVNELATLILRILQRNHRDREEGRRTVSYYPFQISSILAFELTNDERPSFGEADAQFRQKFAEAVHQLQHGGFIMQDPTQTHSQEFQRPTSKGLQVDTTAPMLGITSGEEFVRKVEVDAGALDSVAKAYLMESYGAAEHHLWLSSIFMLGAASERLIYVLAEHIDHLLADPVSSTTLSKINSVRQRKEWIVSHLSALQKKYPAHREAFRDVEDKFDSLYNTYRYQRNAAGHPRDTLFAPDTQQAKAMLFSFGLYAQAVNAILAIR